MCRTTLEYINFYRTHLDADIFLYKKFKCFTGTGKLLVSELVCNSLGSGAGAAFWTPATAGYHL